MLFSLSLTYNLLFLDYKNLILSNMLHVSTHKHTTLGLAFLLWPFNKIDDFYLFSVFQLRPKWMETFHFFSLVLAFQLRLTYFSSLAFNGQTYLFTSNVHVLITTP